MKKVSFVIPVFNEEESIPFLYQKLQVIMHEYAAYYTFEVILVNDGSSDASWNIIKQLFVHDERVKGIAFSRNFGHQMALTAGYDKAKGDAIIAMDADLQHPPELVRNLLQKWEEGFFVVYARRTGRKDGFFKKITAFFYYKLLSMVSDIIIPRNVGDFRLIDKRVLKEIQKCRESARYLRGMVAWTGFNHTFIDFEIPKRMHGTPSYTWKKSLQLAFDGLANFSLFPLRIAAFMGIIVVGSGSCMLAYISIDFFIYKVQYPLFKWLVTVMYIFMGVQFFLMWLLGEYIGRMYEQQKQRPLYIVKEEIGFKSKEDNDHFNVPMAGFTSDSKSLE